MLALDADRKFSLQTAYIHYFTEFCERFGIKNWHAYNQLDSERLNIYQALDWAYELQIWANIGEIVNNISEYLDWQGRWVDLVAYIDFAIEAGLKTNNRLLIAKQKIFKGWIQALRLGRDPYSCIEDVMDGYQFAQEIEDEKLQGIALHSEASIRAKCLGQYNTAGELYAKASSLFQKLGDKRWNNRTTGMLGSCFAYQRDWDNALKYYQQYVASAKDMGDQEQIALGLGRVGNALWHKGLFVEARDYVKQGMDDLVGSMVGATTTPDVSAKHLELLARTEYSLGNNLQATQYLEQASSVLSTLQNKDLQEKLADLLLYLEQFPNDPSAYLAKHNVQVG